ncbi:probable methyltransferase At1g27930 [Solanum pennellii]|uniref:Probable methyltransferase At1g27930 n=1 Tax=Solanum pennellii TaxID=28526 RepID=A0ABM1FJ81_SOLPN|nr:probable methyltransferase At1g27930 [Solanum pennellii]
MVFSKTCNIGQGASSDCVSSAYMEVTKYSKGSVDVGTPFPKPLHNIVVKKVADMAGKGPGCKKIPCQFSSPIFSSLPLVEHSHNLLAEKEINFLYDLLSQKSPCNILVFGLETQYSFQISTINRGGFTVFLEDNPANIKLYNSTSNADSTCIHRVEYQTVARDAYKILKHVRENQKDCYISAIARRSSSKHDVHSSSSRKCKFMSLVTNVPKEVYEVKWDLVIVDGPEGDNPESPGRMAAIYIADIVARRSKKNNGTHVLVYDVDRMIEKWFSWEFLCDTNLVSSKGKFWDFNILAKQNATTFCPA